MSAPASLLFPAIIALSISAFKADKVVCIS